MKDLGIGSRVKHSRFGDGILCRLNLNFLTINFFEGGFREINRKSEELEIVEALEPEKPGIALDDLEYILNKAFDKYVGHTKEIELGDKWKGGLMVLEPADENLQAKEIPIEKFFHKIVMLRDRLRVLEQNINKSPNISDEEKVHIQQYITRSYGSLTSFNVLFKNKHHQFKGAGK